MSLATTGLTRAQVATLVGMSDSWVRDRMLAGDFPRPGQPAPVYVQALLKYRGTAKLEAERTRLTAAQAEAVERKNRSEEGELVEMEIAEAVLFETTRAARDAWINWPSKVAPVIAAQIGTDGDRLRIALEEHVNVQLQELGEPEEGLFARAE